MFFKLVNTFLIFYLAQAIGNLEWNEEFDQDNIESTKWGRVDEDEFGTCQGD